MTFGVEKVPIGKNRFVGIPHNYHSSSLERANVLLRKISTQSMNIVCDLVILKTRDLEVTPPELPARTKRRL